jgi:hypothetical protein
VLTTTLTLTAVAALLLPGLDWTAAAWLLPSLGLAAAALASATVFSPWIAAAAIAALWIAVCGSGAYIAANSESYAFEDLFAGLLQIALLFVTLASVAVLLARRDEFERGERR